MAVTFRPQALVAKVGGKQKVATKSGFVLAKLLASVAVAALVMLVASPVLADNLAVLPTSTLDADAQVDICHDNNGASDFSVVQAKAGAIVAEDNQGHPPDSNHENDVIPTFTFDFGEDGSGVYPGRNWTTDFGSFTGEELFANDCNAPVEEVTPPTFPSCTSLLKNPGDKASFETGMHQIAGGDLVSGADDVYSLSDGNAAQCFCPNDGQGIQTNWWKTDESVDGWISIADGEDWNLDPGHYLAMNMTFDCPESSGGDNENPPPPPPPTPNPPPPPQPTPPPPPPPGPNPPPPPPPDQGGTDEDGDGDSNGSSHHRSSSGGRVALQPPPPPPPGQVLGDNTSNPPDRGGAVAGTVAGLPVTGAPIAELMLMMTAGLVPFLRAKRK